MMSDDVRDELAQGFPPADVVVPPVDQLWARGRRQRRRRTVAQAAGATASIVALAGLGVVYGLPEPVIGPSPAPQIGSDDLPGSDQGHEQGDGDGSDGPRWEVCDYADLAEARTDGTTNWERNIARACEQVRAGQQPDRPDIVECYSRTDEPGGLLAGDIATERCDELASRDTPIPVDRVDDLARSRPHADRQAALSGWQPTSPAPDAVQLLAVDAGERAWYVSEEATGPDSWLAYGATAWDDRLGTDADTVCAWLNDEIAAVLDDGTEIVTNDHDAEIQSAHAEPKHRAVSVVLNSALEGTVGDGIASIVVERCDP